MSSISFGVRSLRHHCLERHFWGKRSKERDRKVERERDHHSEEIAFQLRVSKRWKECAECRHHHYNPIRTNTSLSAAPPPPLPQRPPPNPIPYPFYQHYHPYPHHYHQHLHVSSMSHISYWPLSNEGKKNEGDYFLKISCSNLAVWHSAARSRDTCRALVSYSPPKSWKWLGVRMFPFSEFCFLYFFFFYFSSTVTDNVTW